MKLSDFDYNLPKELIAQYPLKERDAARLLVLERSSGEITHQVFRDLVGNFSAGDIVILNNTRVLPSRLKGFRKTGGKVEILLLKRCQGSVFNALIKPARLKLGEKIIFNSGKIIAEVTARDEVRFNLDDTGAIYNLGVMPLPPYIKREPEPLDKLYYQTVYAKEPGSVASPTAGLHFTEKLIEKMRSSGIGFASVTLHVGHATFKPVKADDITTHKMGLEYFKLPVEALKLIEEARSKQARIFSVGTTTCRALESYASSGLREAETDLFIYPGYKFKLVNCLLTNFHLPRTTLFMLTCAFAGKELIHKAYAEAIAQKYRFYSYGDAMLII